MENSKKCNPTGTYFLLQNLSMAAYVFLILFLSFGVCRLDIFDLANGKKCFTRQKESKGHHSIYKKVFFCCNNFEDNNGECIECKIGFLSAQGKSCSPCTSNMFGMKCSEICNCKKNESCNHVYGCTSITTQTDKAVTMITEHAKTYKLEDKVNKVFLYTVCTGALALIMVLASSTLTYYRREKSKGNNSKNDKQGGDNQGRSTIITV